MGYYSRARNLHYAAKQIVALGHFPDTLDEILKLKGVGDYTAAAIGSIAFGLPAAVVDGNVYRVLARHFGIDTPINTTEGKKTFTALAQSLLPSDNYQLSARTKDACYQRDARIFNYQLPQVAAYNQAIMDFGAIQCTPSSPNCPNCPLQESCSAFRSGRVSDLPVKQKTLKVRERHLIYIYIRYNGQTAIHRRGPGDIWQGLYEPWLVSSPSAVPAGAVLQRQNVKHVLTHRILLADFYLLETPEKPSLPPDYIWIKETELDSYAVPRLIDKFLQDFR